MKNALMCLAIALAAGSQAACTREGQSTGPDGPRFLTQLGCDTTPSCSGGDPNPEAPGYWLGSTVTPDVCFSANGAGINDADHDLMSDWCEWQLARQFEPELAYGLNDNVAREPRWAVRGTPADGGAVYIMYLLSYHIDLGTSLPACENAIGASLCRGHYGDSEWISLLIRYVNGRWVLSAGYLSQHEGLGIVKQGAAGYANFIYPTQLGGQPRVYISFAKHANYESPAKCSSRGFESCIYQAYAKIGISESGNIGRSQDRLVDCVTSTDPFYAGNGVSECYWSGSRFGGWSGALPDASGYYNHLYDNGFVTLGP